MADRIFQPYPGEILPGGEGVQPQISTATAVSGASVGTATPQPVASAPAVGTSVNASHEDHAHEGVHSVNGSKGDVTVTVPAEYASAPQDVASAAAVGTSPQYSPGDHAHKGVHSITVNGGAAQFGDVAITTGSGLTRDRVLIVGSGTFVLASDNTKIYFRIVSYAVGGSCTIQLPDPTTHHNEIWIKLQHTPSGNLIIKRFGAENIENTASDLTMVSTGPRMCVFVSDGTDWWIMQAEL